MTDVELFQAIIDDHRRRPRNRGSLPGAHRVATRENSTCGDHCTLHLRLDGERIAAASFTGAGCALSQASASLCTVALVGRTADEARGLTAHVEHLVRTGAALSSATPPVAASAPPLLDDLAALSAVHAFPARHACALLAWQAALSALERPAG
jgi:nitrogen fixation NifU-like protein